METHRPRRRRSRRRARKKQIIVLVIVAFAIGAIVWTRILIDRRLDATLAAGSDRPASPTPAAEPVEAIPSAPGKVVATTTGARNLVLFVGNGYGIVPMTAARIFANGEDGKLAIDRLPETALVRTYSRNAQSADSAAAMTAYMTGVRVDNGVLSQSSDTHAVDEAGRPHTAHAETTCPDIGNGKPVPTLLELAKGSGRSTGVVTTSRLSAAVTAASFAHLCHRGGENAIAAQLVPGGPGSNRELGKGVDVLLGGGWQHFLTKDDPRGSVRNDSRDLIAEMRAKGYTVLNRQNELAALAQQGAPPVERLLGLFNRAEMNFDIDRLGTQEPSLAEMTTRAIALLARNPKGYVLIVEGGRIGDALDASLAQKALQDARAFDEAVAAALDQIRLGDPALQNTTVVVTANHDKTLMMNGNAAATKRTMEARPGVLGVLHAYTEPTQFALDASGRPYTTLVFGAGEKRIKGPRSQGPALSDLALADRNSRYEAAVEVTGASGGTDVMLGAIGAKAASFHGTLDNTQVFTLLREALGL